MISDGLLSELVLSYMIPGVKTNIFREVPFRVVPLQKGAAATIESKTAWPGCPKGLCALGNQGAKLVRKVSQTRSRRGDGKSCRWWWRPGMGISCFGRDPVPNVYGSAAAIKSCVPSAGWFSQGFYAFCDDSLVCGNLLSCWVVFSVYILWVSLYSSKSLQS